MNGKKEAVMKFLLMMMKRMPRIIYYLLVVLSNLLNFRDENRGSICQG